MLSVKMPSVKKLSEKVTPTFALLLQGQIRSFKKKSTGWRWTKPEKITALRIYKRSPTCYRLLRRLFHMPSPTTLKTLLNKVPFGVGVNQPVFKVQKKEVLATVLSSRYIYIAAIVCDMDGVNRRALAILGASVQHPYYMMLNREVVTCFDTLHLLKCFRNLFMKYNIECTTNISSNEKSGRGELSAEATVTANVLSNMDKLFDALNSDCSDLRRGKPLATNLRQNSQHLKFFEEMKKFFSTLKYVASPRTPPSQEGWIWTLNAMERLWRNSVRVHKITSLATRRLQQDALENLFGCIRGKCGSNKTPTCGQFVAGLKTAISSNLAHIGTTGNCENDSNVVINNFERQRQRCCRHIIQNQRVQNPHTMTRLDSLA